MVPEKTTLGNPSAAEPLFQPPSAGEPQRNWPMVVGLAIVVAVLVGGTLIWRSLRGPEGQGPPSYASHLKFSDVKLSQAQNFVGGTVTYVEGAISNAGDKPVAAVSVNVTFRNTLDEVAQRETLPVRILDRSGPYPDTVDMRLRPLAPGQQREFRLTFEHLSSDWNQQAPELRVVGVSLQ